MSFQVVADVAELVADAALALDVSSAAGQDVAVAIVQIGDELFAVEDQCSHAQVRLSEGDVDVRKCAIECWLHGASFDLRTGAVKTPPATAPIKTYPCKIDDGQVWVDVDEPSN